MASASRDRISIRRRTWQVMEVGAPDDQLSRTIDLMIMSLVFGNVVAVVLESVPSIGQPYHDLFLGFERVSVAAFSAEFVCRLWSAAEKPGPPDRPDSATRRRLRYLGSPMAIIDVLAISPFYLSALFSLDLRFLRVLRLLRVVKLTRYSSALGRIVEVFQLQRKALAASLFVLTIAIVMSASVVYVVEHSSQPEAFGSIPAAMWWAVVTLTTVGYGDVSPITPLGKLLAACIQIIGIGMVALPSSLFASGFAVIMARSEHELEVEARAALADGELTLDEVDAYAHLAEQLQIDPESARRVMELARREQQIEDLEGCPHCGKQLVP